MNGYAIYEVTGRRQYRGHRPGSRFEARLDPHAEERAIVRGDIRLIERIEQELEPGSYRLHPDWPPQPAVDIKQTEAPKGASRIREKVK